METKSIAPTWALFFALAIAPAIAAYVTQAPSSPAGASGQVQWNNAGILGGTSALTATSSTVAFPGLSTQGQVCNSAAGALSTSITGCPGTNPAYGAAPATLNGATSQTVMTLGASPIMGGNGTTCTITPNRSGNIFAMMYGVGATGNTTALTAQLKYGTGTAPAKAAAATGTNLGPSNTSSPNNVNNTTVWGTVSGLTIGTAYWIDYAVNGASVTWTQSSVTCVAFEF